MRIRLRIRRSFRKVSCWLALLAALTSLTPSVWAHAKLLRSEPSANATLKQAPKTVELWFSEELEAMMSTIVVTDQTGKRVDRGNVSLGEGNKRLQIDLEELGAGRYTVDWKALSTDEHTMKGKFTFTVAQTANATANPTITPPSSGSERGEQSNQAASAAPAAQETEMMQESGTPWSMSFVRWLEYLAMMTLFGGFAFRLLVLAPALGRAGTGKGEAARKGERRIIFLCWLSVVLLVITSLIGLVQQASAVFDKSIGEALAPSLLVGVLTKTGYGGAWLLKIVTAAALVVTIFLLESQTKRAQTEKQSGLLWWVGLVAGAALLVAPSWTGHAAASIKDFRYAVLTDWLHLLAGGFWVGSLFHLALSAGPALTSLDPPRRTRALNHMIKLFTRIAVPGVALLVLAGLYNSWVHVESFSALWTTAYGRTLLIKLILVGIMLLLGGLNNFHFGKKAAQLSASEEGASAERDHAKLEGGFSRSVMVEAVIGVIVLLITAVLVFLTPAREHPAAASRKTESAIARDRR